jgi:hypothetical protein
MIKATLKLNDFDHKATGKTIIEALDKIVAPLAFPSSKTLKTSGLITITDGKRTSEVDLRLAPLKRFINNRLTREIWANRLLITMK